MNRTVMRTTKPFHENKNSKDIMRALMDPMRPVASDWSSSDLATILEHQLASPLIAELDRFAELSSCSKYQASSIMSGCGSNSFGELIHSPAPSLSALILLKDYAKASLANEGDLPRDVARVLYVIVILRGRQIEAGVVSTLDDASLQREAYRCLTFGWLPENIRELLRRTISDG